MWCLSFSIWWLHLVLQSLGPSMLLQMTLFHSFLWLSNIPLYKCTIPRLLYPFICRWTFRLLPCLGYCKQCCNEHWATWMLSNSSQAVLVVKNLPANAGDIRDMGSIPGFGISPGEGHGNPLQYSCLENPMDRGAWWVTVHGSQRVGYSCSGLARHSMLSNCMPRSGVAGSYGSSIFSLFCVWCESVLTSLIYMMLSSFPNTTCWRDCLFSIVYSCLLC